MTPEERIFPPVFDTIIRCPHCGQAAAVNHRMGYGPVDETLWSDGWNQDRWSPDCPSVIRCRKCRTVYWVEEGRGPRENPPGSPQLVQHRTALRARFAAPVPLGDLQRFLTNTQHTPEREQRLRQELWWRLNHLRRGPHARPFSRTQAALFTENLLRLLEVGPHDDGPVEEMLCLRCEALRELGLFRESVDLAERTPHRYDHALRQIVDRSRNKESRVFRLDMRLPDLVLESNITGLQYHHFSTPALQKKLKRSTRIVLRREPANAHDPNAVAVLTAGGLMIGYIPRDANHELAHLIDAGERMKAVISSVDHNAPEWERVRIAVLAKYAMIY